VNQLSVFLKQWMEKESIVAAILYCKAFGKIKNIKLITAKFVIPGGVDIPDFRQIYHVARRQLGWPQDRDFIYTPPQCIGWA